MRSDKLYLDDLIGAAKSIAQFTVELTAEQFVADDEHRSAVMWKLMVIGEAASKLSPEAKALFADPPWDQIRGFRNLIVHGYFSLDWNQVWAIATRDVPVLLRDAENVQSQLK
jgi:uncharacterized protein with HEPN domain